MSIIGDAWVAYRMRWKRRRYLYRALRRRHQLRALQNRTNEIAPKDILAFATVRNEALRLPYFLQHHRALGVRHFLIVDNNSDDGTTTFLAEQKDVSLWHSTDGYKNARFGMDWLTWLMIRYGHDHWCLTLDADELFFYPHWTNHGLPDLTAWLDAQNRHAFGALMLDMYPKGPTNRTAYRAGQDPLEILQWFDPGPYRARRQKPLRNLWQQGGVRERVFFRDTPRRSPTLNKLPLVRWNRRHVYVNSTHSMLPPKMNLAYDGVGGAALSGVLLHTKFLHTIAQRSIEEQKRKEHFRSSAEFDDYYKALTKSPDLWCESSCRYTGWQQLVDLGLMSAEPDCTPKWPPHSQTS